nr:PREDICTED: uncharacterized protein LOC109039825 [Bemisia tabaci]
MQPGALLTNSWRNASEHGGRCTTPAQWNVSGKVSTKCFWNACKALSVGLLLMLIGGSMATIGYYADQQSAGNETRGNSSASNVWVKHDARGFHLNNLSYAGPIVMGVGGFIVVAACVMTFEARDTAAKVAAARGKASQSSTHRASKHSPREGTGSKQTSFRDSERRKTSSSQLNKWDYGQGHKGRCDSFVETSSGPRSPISTEVMSRRALTAAFIQFSRTLEQGPNPLGKIPLSVAGINRCPSAPSLVDSETKDLKLGGGGGDSPILFMSAKASQVLPSRMAVPSSYIYQQRRDRVAPGSGCTLLNPHSLLKRQAMSVDIPDYCSFFSPPRTPQHVSRQGSGHSGSRESVGGPDPISDNSLRCMEGQQNRDRERGSQASMAMDLHLPDYPVTLRIKDRTKQDKNQGPSKSPSFQRRQLLRRQTQIEHHEADGYQQEGLESRSMPHSRQESFVARLSPRSSFDDSARMRILEAPRDSIAGMANQKYKYSRAKTFDESSAVGSTKGRQKGSGKRRQRRKSDDRRRCSIPTPEPTTPVSPHRRRSPAASREISPAASRMDALNLKEQYEQPPGSPMTVINIQSPIMIHPTAQSTDKTDHNASVQVHENPSAAN